MPRYLGQCQSQPVLKWNVGNQLSDTLHVSMFHITGFYMSLFLPALFLSFSLVRAASLNLQTQSWEYFESVTKERHLHCINEQWFEG